MPDEFDLPWPLCLGAFDEESCRYFLHEIGSRIVPNYPFSFGMEEVYGLILEKYGHHGTPDVTGLLQELLEDDQCASGLGDDGDVWRSWRHGWRHRNDDILNPFIPRFGPHILRPSTTPRIRLLKANNFTQKCDDSRKSFEPSNIAFVDSTGRCSGTDRPLLCSSVEVSSNATTLPSTIHETSHRNDKSSWRQRLRSLTQIEKSTKSRHTRSFSATDIEHKLSVLHEESSLSKSCSAQLREDERACKDILGRSPETEQPVQDMAGLVPADLATVTAVGQEIATSFSPGQKKGTSISNPDGGLSIGYLKSTGSESQSDKTDSPRFVVQAAEGSDLSDQPPGLTPNHKRRATNRQARLIDGTIFITKNRKPKVVSQTGFTVPRIANESGHRTAGRLSWSPIGNRGSTHSNWAREFGRFLHPKRSKQSAIGLKHQSVPAPQRLNTICQVTKMSVAGDTSLQHSSTQTLQSESRNFGLDGASDLSPTCKSSPDLNKPLPLNPDEIVRSMSSRSQTRSSQSSDHTSNLLSATSTASSISRSSSKRELQGVARDLLQTDMLGPHDLPPIREVDTHHRDCIEPQKTPAPPESPFSYSSIAQDNPYTDEKARSPVRPPHNGEMPMFTTLPTDTFTSMEASNSKIRPIEGYFPSMPWSKPGFNEESSSISIERGRKMPAPGSPTQSKTGDLTPKTLTKRSRSPIKRFLGLTKSNSTNKLEEFSTPPRPVTPGSTKDSLKKWGDRIRHGFVPIDQEQLRQEELIEAHHNESTASTPQKSTFPVSLEPPVQAKIQSEIELILAVTANRYLLREASAGRISVDSVARTKEVWEKMNRPQVVEFHYDQLTQHNLVMSNLDRVKLYGDASKDAIAINSTMRGWKIMAREMSIRTFCSPDSVIRKHLHDAHRVLELLGAPLVTFLAYEDMQLKTLTKISQRQKERMERRAGSAGRNASNSSNMSLTAHHRHNASEGSYTHQHDSFDYPITALQMDKISLSPSPTPISKTKVRKATGAEGAIMSLPTNFDRSRDRYASNLKSARTGFTEKKI